MDIPEGLHYSSDHEWARLEGGRDAMTVRVGITDYAQDALGDVVYVEVPVVGATISAGDAMGEIESTKSVSEIYAPVSGTVVAGNPDFAEAPERINEDPYGEGWICEIAVEDACRSGQAARRCCLSETDRGLSCSMAGEVTCSGCGHLNPLGSNFCSSCGKVIGERPDDTTAVFFDPDLGVPAVAAEAEPGEADGLLIVARGPNVGARIALSPVS